jgi:hypothetical protein
MRPAGFSPDVPPSVESIPTTRTSLHNARFLHYLLHAAFTAFSTRYLNVMAPIDDAVAAIRASDGQKIGTVARAFGVHRTTLSRRIHGQATSRRLFAQRRQLLTPQAERLLIREIWRLCEWCLPPTPAMVRVWAGQISGKEPGKNWSAGFRRRHEATLDQRYLNTLDLERHRSESESSFRQYFTILEEKIALYNIQPNNCYNMDEKGFLIGHLQKVQRIFPKALIARQKLLGTGQDGNREWITIVATICADGTSLPPALIYKAVSGDLQDIWLQDYDPLQHRYWFASSPNGWTNNELGLSWLQSLFDTETRDKAKRDWRLLILDGHGSHCTIAFLDWCKSNRILVAIFPPHATHRLQPLDVSIFRPLATYYSQELDRHTRQSQGLTSLTKRDFFHNFDTAYCKAFTEANISSAWLKTGLEPFNPAEVLQIFDKGKANELTHSNTPHGSQSSRELSDTCLPTPTRLRSIRRLVGEDHGSDFQRVIKKLADTCVAFATELTLSRDRERGYIEALNNQKKKQKRGKPFTETLRAEGDLGVLFFSPRKVERAKELQAVKEAIKEDEVRQKELRVEERALQKARKQLEAQQKRDDRAARASSRKTVEALKRANRQQQIEAKQAIKRSAVHLDTTNTRLTKVRKLQKRPQKRVVVEAEPAVQQPQMEVRSRSGRAIKARPRFEPT